MRCGWIIRFFLNTKNYAIFVLRWPASVSFCSCSRCVSYNISIYSATKQAWNLVLMDAGRVSWWRRQENCWPSWREGPRWAGAWSRGHFQRSTVDGSSFLRAAADTPCRPEEPWKHTDRYRYACAVPPPLGNVVREVLSILDLEFSSRGNTQGTGRVPVSLENQPRMQRVDGTQMWREMSNNQEQMGSDQEAKRRWEKSGMSWMKKNSDQRPWDNDGNPGDEDSDSKRRWEKFLTHKHKMAIPWISMRNMSEFSLEDDIPMSRIWLQQTDSICYETDKNSTWYF